MRQVRHVHGVSGVLLAWALVMAAGSGECLAQTSSSNDGSGSGGKAVVPPPPVIVRPGGGRPALPSTGAKLPSTRADLPGRSNSGFGGGGGVPPRTEPPVIQPVQPVDSTNVIPIGRPNDPARVLREWRDFNAGLTTTRPRLFGETSAAPPVIRPRVKLGNGFRPPDEISGQIIYQSRLGGSTYSVDFYNGLIQTGLGSELGWQSTLLYNPYLRSLYYPYYCGSEGRVVNPSDFMHYDPALSPNFDPQRAQQDFEKPQAAVVKVSSLERAEAALQARKFAAASRAYRQVLKENPDDHASERAMGVAELMSGNIVDGVSIVSRAYLAEPALADEAFTGSELGLNEADLRDVSGRVVAYANRTPTVASLVTAAVLLQGRDRVDAAVGMIDRATKVGLNAELAGMLTRSMKPAATAAVVAPPNATAAKVAPKASTKASTKAGPKAGAKSGPATEKSSSVEN